MEINNQTQMFKTGKKIALKLRDKGFDSYFVGGCVRDLILKDKPLDYDITTSATPEQIIELFPHTIEVGMAFGVIIVVENGFQYELATFRNDGVYLDGRRPDGVIFSSFEEDVKRRDFTINGLLLNPVTMDIIDLVNGLEDIENGIIRAIGDPHKRFEEDKLRLLRAVRFASRLKFKIEKNTWNGIKKLHKDIIQVSKERIREEIEKIILDPNRVDGLKLLFESGLLKSVLPDIYFLKDIEQPPLFHPEGNVLNHIFLVLENMNRTITPELAWAGLLHDVGKKHTFKIINNKETFHKHESFGALKSEEILEDLKASRNLIVNVSSLIKDHMKLVSVKVMKDSKFLKMLAKEFKGGKEGSREYFRTLLELNRIDSLSSNGSLEHYNYAKERMENFDKGEEKVKCFISGKDLIQLGIKPGPIYKELLDEIYNAQLESLINSREEALVFTHSLIKTKFLDLNEKRLI
jgi:tRNA nucleotidyltransferase/poly(A) polymerase